MVTRTYHDPGVVRIEREIPRSYLCDDMARTALFRYLIGPSLRDEAQEHPGDRIELAITTVP